MWYWIIIGLLIATGVALVVNVLRQKKVIVALREESEAIIVEEKRMFNFLSGLGETLCVDVSDGKLQRTVVDGVSEVVGAEGGALYL